MKKSFPPALPQLPLSAIHPSASPYPSSVESPSLTTCLGALELLNLLDSASNLNPPSLLTVFRLYCGERLSVSQVARRCRCSVGTVSSRLKLLYAKVGLSPAYIKKAPRSPSPHQRQAPNLNFQNVLSGSGRAFSVATTQKR